MDITISINDTKLQKVQDALNWAFASQDVSVVLKKLIEKIVYNYEVEQAKKTAESSVSDDKTLFN